MCKKPDTRFDSVEFLLFCPFLDRKRRAPEAAGHYYILFIYIDGSYEIHSEQVCEQQFEYRSIMCIIVKNSLWMAVADWIVIAFDSDLIWNGSAY